MFACLINRTFSPSEQYFSLTINQRTVLLVMAYHPSEQSHTFALHNTHVQVIGSLLQTLMDDGSSSTAIGRMGLHFSQICNHQLLNPKRNVIDAFARQVESSISSIKRTIVHSLVFFRVLPPCYCRWTNVCI
jgi:hypothetical protein